MESLNSFRNLILRNSSKICENSTVYSFIVEEVFTNIKFLIFVLAFMLIPILMLILIYIRRGERTGGYLIYPIGIYVFAVAILFKILKSDYGSLITDMDQQLYNALKGIDESKSSMFPGIILFVLGGTNKNGHVSNCEIDKINNCTKLHSKYSLLSFLSGSIDETSSFANKNGSLADKINSFTDKNGSLADKSNSFTDKNDSLILNQKRKATINISRNGIESHIPNTTNIVEKQNNPNLKTMGILLKPHVKSNENSIKITETLSPEHPSPSNSENTNSNNTDHSKDLKNKPQHSKINEPAENKTSTKNIKNIEEESRDENFPFSFRNIHKVLNKEFLSNNKASSNFKEMNKVVDNIEVETQKLEGNLKKFFVISNKIEKELKSFNASVKTVEDLWGSVISNLKKFSSLKIISLNLNFKQSNDDDLNKVFRVESSQETLKNSNSSDGMHTLIMIIQTSLVIQAILAVIFLYMLMSGRDVFLIKFLTSIFLVGNCILGIILMVQAHFLDRDCVLGRIPNCATQLSKDFIEFARSADLEIKSPETGKVNKLQKSLDKIDKRTQNITNVLKDFFRDSPVKEFQTHQILIKNLFNKINFVKDDFNELTHSKINKTELFSLIDKIDINLAQISQDLEFIDLNFLLEFFSKESAFQGFLKEEKDRLILETEKQLDIATEKKTKENKDACEEKRQAVCRKRTNLTFVSLILTFGSLSFMISFILL